MAKPFWIIVSIYKINQYFVEMNNFSWDSFLRNVPITKNENMAKNIDAIRVFILAEMIWQQTAIERGDAVSRMQWSQ